jgi:hypothetical protein
MEQLQAMIEPVAVSIAHTEDLTYVVSLMRANRESVGGLPVPAVKERVERGTVLLAKINGDPVGYLLFDNRAGVIRIPQACIQYDARRRHYGVALVTALLEQYPNTDEVSLRCAADLEANIFWRDMGFVCVGTRPGGKRRGRTINSWTLWLTPRLFTAQDIAQPPAAQIRQDAMYDNTDYLTSAPEGFQDAVLLPKLAWSNRT